MLASDFFKISLTSSSLAELVQIPINLFVSDFHVVGQFHPLSHSQVVLTELLVYGRGPVVTGPRRFGHYDGLRPTKLLEDLDEGSAVSVVDWTDSYQSAVSVLVSKDTISGTVGENWGVPITPVVTGRYYHWNIKRPRVTFSVRRPRL